MRTRILLVLGLSFLLFAVVVGAEDVTVSYLGHSCFTIQAEDGSVIMLDPYATYVPYPGLPVPADIVMMTHQHIDHCPWCFGESDRVEGDPILVYRWTDTGRCNENLPPGSLVITEEFKTNVVEASHVTASGQGAGWVCMYAFEVGGIRFAHLGDLGKVLTTDQIEALGDVDVLFLPVGGGPTIGAAEAMTVIAQLPSVKVVLPMHTYVEGFTPWESIGPLEDFTRLASAMFTVHESDDFKTTIHADTLPPSTEVWILQYKP